ncbi:MAG TPA: competence/damage-inducible protein A [Candidatus Sumerlaeota bacterium]|nr:competence/damage-inducible protein A [Candidatus Sumerlaeota bacterium]
MKQHYAEIISSGTEITDGLMTDTNAGELAQRLGGIGIEVHFLTGVGDNLEHITEALKIALKRASIVIMTGGLGPTEDDLTRQAASLVFERPLVRDEMAADMIKAMFSRRHKAMPECNLVQALVPEGCSVLYNEAGTAPGFIIHEPDAGRTLVAMPGPPIEWRIMFEQTVFPFLKEHFHSPRDLCSTILHTINIPESRLNQILQPLWNTLPGIELAFQAGRGRVDVRIKAEGDTGEQSRERLALAETLIRKSIGEEFIFGKDGVRLAEAVGQLLRKIGMTLATAESCTGGLVSKRLTDIPGSSEYFLTGVVTYSNEAKKRLLDVPQEVLDTWGAVSGETAAHMVRGIRRLSGADITVSITGIAGPGGISGEKPAGLVYFGMADHKILTTGRVMFNGMREQIRSNAADYALFLLLRRLRDLAGERPEGVENRQR